MSASSILEENVRSLYSLLARSSSLMEIFETSASAFVECLKRGNTVFWCGNGGSAAESSHLAVELIGRFKNNRMPLPSISLNSDSAAITCISNDFGFDQIYSRQLEGLGRSGDVLVVLSTSGMSTNVILALEQARRMGIQTIALLGKGGGLANRSADFSLVVESDETARIQEVHLLIGHTFCEYAELEFGFEK